MAFDMSITRFIGFLIRPFTNPLGWIMLLGAAIWIYLRVTRKVGGFGNKNKKGGGGQQANYTIK